MNDNDEVTLSREDYRVLYDATEDLAYDLLVGERHVQLLELLKRLPDPLETL